MRTSLVKLHRYLGLGMALFLLCAGLTGSVIAFQDRLEIWLNPELFEIDEVGEPSLSATELVARIEASDPRIRVNYQPIVSAATYALVSYVEPRHNPVTGELYDIDYDEVFINPVTGEIKGKRMWGECCFERKNLIPFIYKLHNRLLLPKPLGSRIMGMVALLWVLMSLVGLYLTLPRGNQFLKKWKRAWTVQWRNPWKIKFLQLHKSIGLWCWLLMLSSAVTGLSMNLEDELFNPLVKTVSSYSKTDVVDEASLPANAVDFSSALEIAVEYAERNQLAVLPSVIKYSTSTNHYRVNLAEPSTLGLGPITVYVGAGSGQVLAVADPAGDTAGDFVAALRLPLHSGRVAGTAGSVLVALTGLMTALMVIVGVSMWFRRRFR
ncbi:PepSY-associated TM helix domain-containing protein [Arenicella xantha]|uniref:Putative iron-regulated membrane protein n=1 Tax=Arenicella xantha TaxID=644221 RepID=A0A395JNN4_9GAMM|nr:PepSY-associated TM helix domain-containing protein [Arenicella xantha]RBP52923.1 putative iron-regulated membrane protein [Arenicella xantha]